MPGVVSSPLAGLRILVVEDEVFIAWEIEERLQRLGCEVVGPVGHLEHALQLARSTALDGALLDVNIKGGVVYPVAAELLARQVPVVFASGYAPGTLPAVFRDLPCLRKPFGAGQLESIAHEAFLGPRGKPTPR
jgi:CheY-like chemotaxis protein